LIVNSPTGGETGYRNIRIAYFVVKWIEEEGGDGIAFDFSTEFTLPNGANRSPDAALARTGGLCPCSLRLEPAGFYLNTGLGMSGRIFRARSHFD
jgi:hypothetical protein